MHGLDLCDCKITIQQCDKLNDSTAVYHHRFVLCFFVFFLTHFVTPWGKKKHVEIHLNRDLCSTFTNMKRKLKD